MAKFSFVEHEYSKYIVQFEADSLEHARELMEEAMSIDDLPAGEKFWKNGNTDWEDLREED